MKHSGAIAFALFIACSTPSVQDRPPFPPPELGKLSPTELLGYQIHQLDLAAWLATDAALASGLKATPAQGWLVFAPEAGILVRFIGPCERGACSYMDVEVMPNADSPAVLSHPSPEPLPEKQAAMWRARELALSTPYRRCTPKYNTVVVPALQHGEPVWRVYLLAASAEPEEVVLTGHHRVTVSADGRTLVSAEALSKSCIVNRLAAGHEVAALMVTHVLHPEPIETHVFTSLNYRLPLYVGTELGIFKVEGASIMLVEPQ